MILDHIYIFVASVLGVLYHIGQKIADYKKKFPALKRREILSVFFDEEWNSLAVSGLVLITVQFAYHLIHENNVKLPLWVANWGIYVFALVINYSGQRIAYKFLGTTEGALITKIDDAGNKVSGSKN